MCLGLSVTGGLYRPVYWAFHGGSGSLSGPAGVGRPAEPLDSSFGECPLGTQTSFRNPVPSHRSSRAGQRGAPVETNRKNSSSNQEVTVVAGLSSKTSASQISNPRSFGHCALISDPSTNQDREPGSRQLTRPNTQTPANWPLLRILVQSQLINPPKFFQADLGLFPDRRNMAVVIE
jgi:hypothetical protein